jgi:uncharacterized protein (DUF1778 family)
MKDDSPANRQHTAQVLLRFSPEQLAMIDEAADQSGLNRTAWLRMTAIRVAKEELGRDAKGGTGEG